MIGKGFGKRFESPHYGTRALLACHRRDARRRGSWTSQAIRARAGVVERILARRIRWFEKSFFDSFFAQKQRMISLHATARWRVNSFCKNWQAKLGIRSVIENHYFLSCRSSFFATTPALWAGFSAYKAAIISIPPAHCTSDNASSSRFPLFNAYRRMQSEVN